MKIKVRAEMTKGEEIRYISHLDYAGAIERAIRRAGIPAAYSEGFNPHMKLAFASALSVGVTSSSEYMDIELTERVSLASLTGALARTLPQGIVLKQTRYCKEGEKKSLMAMVERAVYRLLLPSGADLEKVKRALAAFDEAETVTVVKVTPKSRKEVEVKQYIASPITLREEGGKAELLVDLLITPSGSINPGQVLQALSEQFDFPIKAETVLIERTGLYYKKDAKWTSLMD